VNQECDFYIIQQLIVVATNYITSIYHNLESNIPYFKKYYYQGLRDFIIAMLVTAFFFPFSTTVEWLFLVINADDGH
jgi:hypothetical protein